MIRATTVAVSVFIASLCGCSKSAPPYGPDYQLSDDDIANYAMQASQPSFRDKEKGGRIIGINNGTRVVSEFPLLDDGTTTVAIIHYDVQPGEACKRAGGLVRLELVPGPASAIETPFCVPKVLVDRNIRTDG
jgi:hypothetical protein